MAGFALRMVAGVTFLLITLASGQSNQDDLMIPPSSQPLSGNAKLYQASQRFALNFFKSVSEFYDGEQNTQVLNMILSPLTVWSLLALISEGASGKTLQEILNVLNIDNQADISANYKSFQQEINSNTQDVEISSRQFLFTDINRPISRDFDRAVDTHYGTDLHEALDFSSSAENIKKSYDYINDAVFKATNGQISKVVHPKDIMQARMIVISALFFQGQWTLPFNRSLTNTVPFYDEKEKIIANVSMMYQKAVFPFAAFRELDAQIVELPYGPDRQLSMMVILPRKGVPLHEVVRRLVQFDMQTIYRELKQAAEEYEDDEVEVFLPRFEITADYHLNSVLFNMGVKAAMSKETAEFEKIASEVFLGAVVQKSKIIVNEEGTTAASASAAVFANKSTPPKFLANRAFAFIIVDKRYDVILFMGQVKQPLAA
ncbi:serine protease inhibitor 77Ba-like isoform X2 [Uranotaenia lowii]|uniref:serine protease inhibitor 77Ba-like isoform X2 n=1 Tax=Uranotaenia lowii TaxID=190385 RepID=UPI0024790392|nr:serine protease inhibitor 77Ba-like isoform X2 [Uranotaenia lowii]